MLIDVHVHNMRGSDVVFKYIVRFTLEDVS